MADSGRRLAYIVVGVWACFSLTGFACRYTGPCGVPPANAAHAAAESLIFVVCLLRLMKS